MMVTVIMIQFPLGNPHGCGSGPVGLWHSFGNGRQFGSKSLGKPTFDPAPWTLFPRGTHHRVSNLIFYISIGRDLDCAAPRISIRSLRKQREIPFKAVLALRSESGAWQSGQNPSAPHVELMSRSELEKRKLPPNYCRVGCGDCGTASPSVTAMIPLDGPERDLPDLVRLELSTAQSPRDGALDSRRMGVPLRKDPLWGLLNRPPEAAGFIHVRLRPVGLGRMEQAGLAQCDGLHGVLSGGGRDAWGLGSVEEPAQDLPCSRLAFTEAREADSVPRRS
ncbi:uncharacterized protein LOC143843408 [Paroedura picta]|uniref:uncharacterized protein LOC143843408 n=1 Tax=Paroedura picta TaxID=143630 RepID=UPI0040578FAC